MVEAVVSSLSSELYTAVKANILGYNTPSKIIRPETEDGFIPDVTGRVEDFLYIYEVETEDTISTENSKNKCLLFSDYATKHNAIFVIVVPTGCKDKALKQTNEWCVTVHIQEI